MVLTVGLAFVLVIVVAVVILGALRGSFSEPAGAPSAVRLEMRLINRSTRHRNVIALGMAAVVIAAGFAIDAAYPRLYGLPAMLAPGVAAIVAVLIVALIPVTRPTNSVGVRAADLTPRRPWSYGPRWAFTLPLFGATAVVAFAVLTGVTSSVSEDGNWRSLSLRAGFSAGPYPGWFYGVPLIAMTVVLAGATLFALGRTASAPRPSDPALLRTDLVSRAQTTRVIMKVSAGALFGYFGGVVFIAGSATRNAATVWDQSGAAFVHLQPYFSLGLAEIVVGMLFGLLGVTLVLLSVLDALVTPSARVASTPLRVAPITGGGPR